MYSVNILENKLRKYLIPEMKDDARSKYSIIFLNQTDDVFQEILFIQTFYNGNDDDAHALMRDQAALKYKLSTGCITIFIALLIVYF